MGSETASKKGKASLIARLISQREETADSVMSFAFNRKRIRLLRDLTEVPERCRGIVYWMLRDLRIQDNWAFLFAQKTALKNCAPLHVCFCATSASHAATTRHCRFLAKGLAELESECQALNIRFHVLRGSPSREILRFVEKHEIGAVVADFSPLKLPLRWLQELRQNLPPDVPLCQVDAHNVVPCWQASDKLEYSARTIRKKITSQLEEFLTEFPPVTRHPYPVGGRFRKSERRFEDEVDETVEEVGWATPGYAAGVARLEHFLDTRLRDYHAKRNDPLAEAVSDLSPWLHFGMISAQRCVLEANKREATDRPSVQAFREEAVVRRELSDNFCFYNADYDVVKGGPNWAVQTLDKHRKDKREHVYTRDELEKATTHDDLWNAAQNQLLKDGKMHGYLRMYWAKKILEWTKSPEEALELAIYLNDKYSLDGCDPNGYVGCMWSICGVHDQGWKEREIFGKIRYMNYKGCERKFDVKAFVERWNGAAEKKSLDKRS